MSSKGAGYEREFCKRLGLWWTNGTRDDVFWRASNSGGRAGARFARGQRTAGQYGDVAATDPIGKPLTDLITWELKRGYSTQGIQDILDQAPGNATRELELFFWQAIEAARRADTPAWALVLRRNQRTDFMWFPKNLYIMLCEVRAPIVNHWPVMFANIILRKKKKKAVVEEKKVRVCGMPVDVFLGNVQRKHIKAALDYYLS